MTIIEDYLSIFTRFQLRIVNLVLLLMLLSNTSKVFAFLFTSTSLVGCFINAPAIRVKIITDAGINNIETIELTDSMIVVKSSYLRVIINITSYTLEIYET